MDATWPERFLPWLAFLRSGWGEATDLVRDGLGARQAPPALLLFGCGDSHIAGLGMEMLLREMAGSSVQVVPSMQAARYILAGLNRPEGSLITIGISASGEVARTIEALEMAAAAGYPTIAVTGNPASSLANAAEIILSLPAPDFDLGPGVPTYTAAQLILAAVAHEFATEANRTALAQAMAVLPDTLETWVPDQVAMAEQAAHHPASHGTVFVGSGPAFGAAAFGAAKLIETAGEPAWRQDVEEWCHLEYFCAEVAMPTWLLSAGGRSCSREEEMVAAAGAIGRRLIYSRWEGGEGQPAGMTEMLSPFALWAAPTVYALVRGELHGELPFRGFGGGRSSQEGGGSSRIRSSRRLSAADLLLEA